jgi:hypothetical protein
MKKIVIRIIVAVIVSFILTISGLYFLTEQPDAPTPKFPAANDRDEAWHQDISFLRDEFLKVDRSFNEVTSQGFLNILNYVYEQVPSLSDNEVVVEITRAVTKSRNAHTRVYLMRNGNYFTRLPVRFNWFSDGLYVVRATDKYANTLGARVLAINNRAPEELTKKLPDFISGSDSWVIYKSTYLLNSPDFLNGMHVVSSTDSIPITFQIDSDETFTVKMAPSPLYGRENPYEPWRDLSPLSAGNLDANSWLHVLSEENLPLYLRTPNQNCRYEYLQDKNALYIQINRNSSDETSSQSEFASEIKRLAETVSPEYVILTLDLTRWDPMKRLMTSPRVFPNGIIQQKIFISSPDLQHFQRVLPQLPGLNTTLKKGV